MAFRVFFRKIYIANADSLPKGKPTLLIANHPTTFTEPCILACFLDRPLFFLVRGDFFAKRLFSALLRDLHMIPIYRMKDGGYRGLRNNFTTFDACYEWLKADRTVMIMGEGSAIYEKRLRPLRKGPARIAMRTMENDPGMELYIVPVGVNYTDSNRFGSVAMIRFDEPFLAREFFGPDRGPKGKAVNAFTRHIREKLANNIVIIEREEDEWLTERLLEMQRNEFAFRSRAKVETDDALLRQERRIAGWINGMDGKERALLKERLKNYFLRLNQFGLIDRTLSSSAPSASFLGVVLGHLPYLAGYWLNALPFQGMRYIVNNKVIFNEFFGSVRIAASIGFFLVYYLLLLPVLLLTMGWSGWVGLAGLPVLGYFALRYHQYRENYRQQKLLRKAEPRAAKQLGSERKQLLGLIAGAAVSD